ncbi:MAG TPA: PhnD/SsuA/transferrin family substrate-binding protein [Nodosilinea sp.]|nr:PhnD/SsuA/transferrin family substrate-binding protein [Nodosilinea sp.]
MISLEYMVCPHDTAKDPDRWFHFAQYLSQHLGVPVHFSVALDFDEFHQRMVQADLVYANPSDTLALVNQNHFSLLAKVVNQSDEVVFVAHPSVPSPSLNLLDGHDVAAVGSMLATQVALQLLHRQGITPARIVDRPTWLSVMAAVAKGEPAYGIVYKDTYDEMARSTKAMTQLVAVSEERLAFHSLVVSPRAVPHRAALETLLTTMATDAKGQDVLQALHVEGWEALAPEALTPIRELVGQPAVVC